MTKVTEKRKGGKVMRSLRIHRYQDDWVRVQGWLAFPGWVRDELDDLITRYRGAEFLEELKAQYEDEEEEAEGGEDSQ